MNPAEEPNIDMNQDCYPGLDERGYPINKRSIYIAIRRELLPTEAELREIHATLSHRIIKVPIRRHKQWMDLVGTVDSVHFFDDGIVVKFPQNREKSLLRWTEAALWIPYEGTAGILNA